MQSLKIALFFLFKLDFNSNYATAAPAVNLKKSASLETFIKELKYRVENKSRLSTGDLHTLLHKLKLQTVDNAQALEILRICSFVRSDENHSGISEAIWKELKKENADFQVHHYNCLLQIARDNNDVKRAQKIFDEMVNDGIKPNA